MACAPLKVKHAYYDIYPKSDVAITPFQNILCLQLVNFTVDSSPVQDRLVVVPGGVHLMES